MTINELYSLIGLNKKVKIKFLRDFPFREETWEVQDDEWNLGEAQIELIDNINN